MKQEELIPDNLKLIIWAAFPSVETFRRFNSDQRNSVIVGKFIDLAYKENLIRESSETAFEELIKRCAELYKNRKPKAIVSFEALIEAIKTTLSIKSLVQELREMAPLFGFETPNEIVFTRFKRDFHPSSMKKHHTVMILAIWLSLHKPDLGLTYPAILAFPRHASDMVIEEKEGLLMEFVFTERRGNIDPSMMDFLKEALPQCIRDLNINYLNEKRINYLATTCLVKFPMKDGFSGLPSTYGEAIRDALSLAYQMAIAWQMSPLYNTRVQFNIAIDAGAFDRINNAIKDLTSQTLPSDYPIRLSHFAYTIAKQVGMRVIFREIEYPNVWAVEHFWAFPYFKTPPFLLPSESIRNDETLMPVTDKSVLAFHDALFSGDFRQFPILSIIHQYPPKVTLSMELAHVATLKRMNHEAIHLLADILSVNPRNHVALTLRLQNLIALGNYAEDWGTASVLYDRAQCDGVFIEKYCPPDPVFYAIYSLLYWSKATKLIKYLRRGAFVEGIEARKAEAFDCLEKAELHAKTGMCVSPSGLDNRCSFWLAHYRAFRTLIEKKPELLTTTAMPFEDNDGFYELAARHVFRSVGWLKPPDVKEAADAVYKQMGQSLSNYLTSVTSISHYANVVFSASTVLWDFSETANKPMIIDQVLMLLDIALERAALLKKLSLGVYICTEIQSPGEFIKSILQVKQAVEEIKRTENYGSGLKLSLMNYDDDTKHNPITFDLIQAEDTADFPVKSMGAVQL